MCERGCRRQTYVNGCTWQRFSNVCRVLRWLHVLCLEIQIYIYVTVKLKCYTQGKNTRMHTCIRAGIHVCTKAQKNACFHVHVVVEIKRLVSEFLHTGMCPNVRLCTLGSLFKHLGAYEKPKKKKKLAGMCPNVRLYTLAHLLEARIG